MKRAINLLVFVAVTLTGVVSEFGGTGVGAAAQAGDFRWRGAVTAGRTVEVRGVNGRVEAAPAAGGEVEVVAVKHGRRSNPAEVRVEVVEHADGVTICAVYPSTDPTRPNVCAPGGEGRMSVNNNDVVVDFTVRVPAGVRLRGLTVNGDVEARGLRSDVEAKTVNGSIYVETDGLASAKTVNGSITAAMGRADWSGGLEFNTVNGGIELSLPASLSAEVEAATLNGEIESDFPLTVTGRYSRRRLTGTVGGGGRELRLKTVNGSVHLKRG